MAQNNLQILGPDGKPIDPRSTAQALPQMEQTKSGLSVPKGAATREQRTIRNQDWKLWRRALRDMAEQGIFPFLICQSCQKSLEPCDDQKALQCGCSLWRLPDWQAPAPVDPADKT